MTRGLATSAPESPSHSSASAYSTSSAARSNNSRSTRKLLASLDNAIDGLELRQLNIDAAPNDSSKQLLRRLRQVSKGKGILPDRQRQAILESRLCCPDQDEDEQAEWESCFAPSVDLDALPGRTPTVEEVARIRKKAEACQTQGQDEAGWNTEVHQVILESVFRDPELATVGRDNFNPVPCTNARPHPAFLPTDAPAKRIDFVIVDDPDGDPDMEAGRRRQLAYRQLSGCTPTTSVNHTDFIPLRLRPILFSIETKPPSVQLELANLQMGVWHAAHWSFLTTAVCHSIRARRAREASSVRQEPLSAVAAEQDIAKLAQEQVKRLPFIPSVIVQGHVWSLVLSTREGSRTILWSHRIFGTTQSMQDIFMVAAGLREVAAWCRSLYMPWWQENVVDGFSERQ